MTENLAAREAGFPSFLRGDTEMVNLMRQFDWSRHMLGPAESWPESLTTSLGIIFASKFPMLVLWGKELFCFYNDAFRPSLGQTGLGKHPSALGQEGRQVWAEVWNTIGSQIEQVLNGGPSVSFEDQLVPIFRNGRLEQVYWTYSYSAITDKRGAVCGVLVTCVETTSKVIAQQNLLSETKRAQESVEDFRSLAENLPYVISRHDKNLRLTYSNSRIAEYAGFNSQHVHGKSFSELGIPADTAFYLENKLAFAFRTGESTAGEFQNGNVAMEARFLPEFDDDHTVKSVLLISTDITQRKNTEHAFQDAKERLQAALDASLTGTFRWNIQTNELSWDRNLDRLFGFPPGESVQSLENFIERVHRDDRQAVIDQCQRCATYGSDFSMEFRVVWPDGTVRWIDDKGKTYRSAAGQPLYMTGACIDVTEEMESRKKLEQSESRFRSTFENAAIGVAHVGLDGRWLLINNTLSQTLGYPKDELAEKTFQDITHPDDLQKDLDYLRDVLAGRISTYTMEKRYQRKDKSILWANLTVSLQRDDHGIPLYFISLIQDISERKEAEGLLKETRDQLTQLSDFMPQMVWATRADGYHDFYNQQWYDFVGLSYDDTKAEGWSKVLHPDDAERTWKIWNESLQTGKLYETKYRMRRHDGEYRWLLARAIPFRNSQGAIVRWFGTCTDIHDQKAAEEQLETLIAERTHRLQRSNEDLQQFAHVASHDLKEPLRKVRLFTEKLDHTIRNGNVAGTFPYLNKIDRSVSRMTSMIDGILEYSSMDATQVYQEVVDLNTVLALTEFDLESLIEKKNARLVYGSLPKVRATSGLLQRVFNNLISNSLKFAHQDRNLIISITATKVVDDVRQGKIYPGEYSKITVKDNGIGFSNAYAEMIFAPFTRLHSKDEYEGTGLGLALCRKIIERLNGSIEASGESGLGATFTILLPAASHG